MTLEPVSDEELFSHPEIAVAIAATLGWFPTEEQQKEWAGRFIRLAATAYVIGRRVGASSRT